MSQRANQHLKTGGAIAGLTALTLAVDAARSKHKPGREPWNPARDRLVDYDYIVVGGGAAGCVVASRLAEDPDIRVLVLEAGGSDDVALSMTPAFYAKLINHPEYDWRLRTVPQRHCNNREMLQPRGKLLGGSSAINAMMYHRGPHCDYDMWGQLGNEGWNYQECLKYFRKSENFDMSTLTSIRPQGPGTDSTAPPEPKMIEPEYHGIEGPWQVSYRNQLGFCDVFFKANLALNVPYCKDYNGATTIGVSHTPAFIQRDGVRSSAARAFLSSKSHVPGGKPDAQNRLRGHIRIVYHAHVQRVLVKSLRGAKVATGVEFRDKDGVHKVCAVREVILSAGAFLSPVILLASGIGSPQPTIPFIHPLPGVGANLTDHLAVSVIARAPATCKTLSSEMAFFKKPKLYYDYYVHRRGLLASNNIGVASFVRLEDIAPDFVEREKAAGTWQDHSAGPDSPHLEFVVVAAHYRHCGMTKPKDPDSAYLTILVVLLNPCSVGRVGIKTAPRSKSDSKTTGTMPPVEPELDPNYLAESFDLRALTEGVRFARKLMREMSNHPAVGGPCKEVVPGEDIADHDDKALHKFIRGDAETLFHPVGTCKMAPESDPMSVVDERLRVRGIDRLRVIDASIMPRVPAAHTTAPSIMIGEKGADMIKEEWEDPSRMDTLHNTLSKL
ncbi:hypothetical protein BGW41_006063 [Actinomortierella wolfii]|nr:hypothetical protein BGW41_006063 [Actinomortierella wolfii]